MDRNLRIRMLLEAGDKVTRPLKDMAAGSSRAAQALKATRDRLKEIDRAQADIAGFRQLKSGLRTTEQAMQAAQTRATQLAREMQQAETPTRKLARDFANAKREAAALGAEHARESVELQRLRDRLAAAGIATSDLARHERDLRVAAGRANTELGEQERRLRSVTDRSKRMAAARESFGKAQGAATGLAASGASGIATGIALGRPILSGVEQAQQFQSGMTDIAQKANLTRVEAERMGAGLLVAARAANQMPEDLRVGVDTLAGFGLDPRKAVAMMQPIGRAATAYKAEIADLSAAAFAANDNLKVPVDQTAKLIDVMASAGKAGAFEVKDMAGAFPALTASYQGLGQKGISAVADLAAGLQIARKGAGDSASAATNLGNVLQKISSPATNKAFAKMGVDLPKALKKAYAEGKTPLEAIAELTNKTLKGDLSRLGYLFEDAQVQQGLRPMIQNMEEFRRIRADAMGASGTTDGDFAERMKDSAEQTKRAAVAQQALKVTGGTQLLPTMDSLSAKFTEMSDRTAAWAEKNPALAKGILIATSVLAGLFVILGGFLIVAAGILGPIALINAGLIATGVAGGLASIGLFPIIATVLAIAGAIALVVAVFNHWGAITAFFSGVWESIKGIVVAGVAAIGNALMTFTPIGIFMRAFGAVMAFLGSDMPGRLASAGRNMILGLIGGITGMLGQLKSAVVNAASAAANWFKQKLGIRSPSRVFMGFGGYMMEGLTNGIAGGEAAPVRRLDRLSRNMTAAIALGAASPGLAATPGGAPGTVGAAAAAGAGARTYHITIQQLPGQDSQALARAVADEIDRRDRAAAARQRSSFADAPDWENA